MTDQELIKQDVELIKSVCDILKLKMTHTIGWVEINHKTFNPLANTPEAKAFCWDIFSENGCLMDIDTIIEALTSNDKQRAVLLAFVELNKKASL